MQERQEINAEHKICPYWYTDRKFVLELWSIFDFVMPGYLYSVHEFRNRYEMPLVKTVTK